MECELLEFNGETDHVHLLVTCPPKRAIANLVGKLKGKSSHFLRKNYWDEIRQKLWGEHFWSPSYCSVTCGGAPLAIVKQYIDEQRRPPTEKGIIASKRENRVNRPGGEMPAGRASNRKQKS
jgi:putative transposase